MEFSVTRRLHANDVVTEARRQRNGFSPVWLLRTYNIEADTGSEAARIADDRKHEWEHRFGHCPHSHSKGAR